MKTLVAAIDCGTSAVKAAVFDLDGNVRGTFSKECPVTCHKDGRIEQDPHLIVERALACLKGAVKLSGAGDIASVSVTGQRATVICTDRKGEPIGGAISWQDLRAGASVSTLRRKISDRTYYSITGLPNEPVFTLAKIMWIRKNEPARYKRTAKFILVHDLVLRALGCEEFITDRSNASLTGMFDISRFEWSEKILKASGVEEGRLPTVVQSGIEVGVVSRDAARKCGLSAGMPIISGGGDQQCAGLGAGAVKAGIAEITLGTACVPLVCSDKVVLDPKRRVMCCVHVVPGKWEVEGLQNSAGASLKWFKGISLEEEDPSGEFVSDVSGTVPGADGVLFYPFLSGASAPNWNSDARGMFLGLRHAHDRQTLVRAVMEGVSMETRQILDVFVALKIPIREIRLTGGGMRSAVWCQIQADIYGRRVFGLMDRDATILGAAMLAALGIGAFRSPQHAARRMVKMGKVYLPNVSAREKYEKTCRKYAKVYRLLEKSGFFKEMSRGMER